MDFATKDLKHGQTNALVKNLMVQMGVDDPVEAVRSFNAGEWAVTRVKFPIWKQVMVGNLGNAKTARKQLKAAGIKFNRWGDDILRSMSFEGVETTLNLVRVSAKELGLEAGTCTTEIYAAAKRYGLSLCQSEVALQLWLQYPDLLFFEERLLVAMEPIEISSGSPDVFCLVRYDSGRWLNVYTGHPDSMHDVTDRWVFAASKVH